MLRSLKTALMPFALLALVLAGPAQADRPQPDDTDLQLSMNSEQIPYPARIQQPEQLLEALFEFAQPWTGKAPQQQDTRTKVSPTLFDGLHHLAEGWYRSFEQQLEQIESK